MDAVRSQQLSLVQVPQGVLHTGACMGHRILFVYASSISYILHIYVDIYIISLCAHVE